jgi:hypothetical protein
LAEDSTARITQIIRAGLPCQAKAGVRQVRKLDICLIYRLWMAASGLETFNTDLLVITSTGSQMKDALIVDDQRMRL